MTSDRRHGRTDSRSGSRETTSARNGGRGNRGSRGAVDKVVEDAMDKAMGKVAEKLDAKAEKLDRAAAKVSEKANRLDRVAAKAAAKADLLDRIGEGLGAFDLWTRAEPSSRRPRFNRDDITAAAVRIADTEGFDALSMRRLATELDAGTMTLYHYVRTKDELLTLAVDAVMGEVVLGDGESLPTRWRDALVMLAERSRAALLRHPWIMDMTDDPGLGPNSVRHFDQTLEAVRGLDVDLETKLDICTVVDECTFGWCVFEREAQNATAANPKVDRKMLDYVTGLVETGDYPALAALRDEYGLGDAWERIQRHRQDPTRFRRNLERLLDGIEADLQLSPSR